MRLLELLGSLVEDDPQQWARQAIYDQWLRTSMLTPPIVSLRFARELWDSLESCSI